MNFVLSISSVSLHSFIYAAASMNILWFFIGASRPIMPTRISSSLKLNLFLNRFFFSSAFKNFSRSNPKRITRHLSGVVILYFSTISHLCPGLMAIIASVNLAKNLSTKIKNPVLILPKYPSNTWP